MAEVVISLNDVWKFYKDFKALEAINFEITKGEIFVLIGPNGSGKSTLLRIISGLISWNRGNLQIVGKSIAQKKPHQSSLRKIFGVMFDHSAHWEKLTGFENAWFFARALGLNAEEAKTRIEELLKWTDLWDRRNDPVSQYSYGMKRKLVLLEALLHNPDILILDEPTIGLDYSSRVAFFKLIQEKAQEGKTIIVSTNDVTEASQIANRIALIYKGKIAAIGDPQQLIKSLDTMTRIEVKLTQAIDLSILNEIEGVDRFMVDNDYKDGIRIWILTNSEKNLLPEIVDRIIKASSSITSLDVQQPGLRDVFLHYTGDSL